MAHDFGEEANLDFVVDPRDALRTINIGFIAAKHAGVTASHARGLAGEVPSNTRSGLRALGHPSAPPRRASNRNLPALTCCGLPDRGAASTTRWELSDSHSLSQRQEDPISFNRPSSCTSPVGACSSPHGAVAPSRGRAQPSSERHQTGCGESSGSGVIHRVPLPHLSRLPRVALSRELYRLRPFHDLRGARQTPKTITLVPASIMAQEPRLRWHGQFWTKPGHLRPNLVKDGPK